MSADPTSPVTSEKSGKELLAGRATALGSWPGTDIAESVATIIGEVPDLPHVVELPGRGLGADMIGRTGVMLVDIELDVATSGYRVGSRASTTGRRARDFLAEDLDVLEEQWELAGLRGSGRTVKVQAAGPFTMAAEVELRHGHRVLTDRGALRDIAESLAEGVAAHADEVARRLGAAVVVQFDEPQIAAVLGGRLLGVTSIEQIAPVPAPDVATLLSTVIERVARPVIVHTCSADVPFEVFGRSGVSAVSFDLSLLTQSRYDAVGDYLEAGGVPILGIVPAIDPSAVPTWRESATPAVQLIDRLGFARRFLAERISVSPTCGLAGASLPWARRALTLVGEVRTALTEDPDSL
ncbi:MAG: methionine synthase [Rhodococcus sp. (in: high G+C Gram-positive bacteria)]